MQVVVYADILFVLNAIITFLMLNLTTDFLKSDAQPARIIFGSLVGGIYSFIIFAPEVKIFLSIIIKSIMLLSIVLISFKATSLRKYLKCIFLFLFISFVFSGVMYFFAFSFLKNKVYMKNGYIYFDIGPLEIIVFIGICFFAIKLLRKALLSKKNNDFIYELMINYNNKNIKIKALYDSGNAVRDPFTGKPVIIINLSEMSVLLSKDRFKDISDMITNKEFEKIPEGVRLLPVSALGKIELIPAVTVDSATVLYESGKNTVYKPSLAFTDNSFDSKKYSALINESVLKGDMNEII